eukprot:Colp12_sorted_trinity150504_noHs@20313
MAEENSSINNDLKFVADVIFDDALERLKENSVLNDFYTQSNENGQNMIQAYILYGIEKTLESDEAKAFFKNKRKQPSDGSTKKKAKIETGAELIKYLLDHVIDDPDPAMYVAFDADLNNEEQCIEYLTQCFERVKVSGTKKVFYWMLTAKIGRSVYYDFLTSDEANWEKYLKTHKQALPCTKTLKTMIDVYESVGKWPLLWFLDLDIKFLKENHKKIHYHLKARPNDSTRFKALNQHQDAFFKQHTPSLVYLQTPTINANVYQQTPTINANAIPPVTAAHQTTPVATAHQTPPATPMNTLARANSATPMYHQSDISMSG